jgi:gamma-glutamyltranspeptidase/glutathione hydrolase
MLTMPTVADEHRSEGLRPAVAEYGMVATSEPLAVEVGVSILKAGGNAIDAAIATNAAIGLTEPMNCGIGGDLFAIVWDAKTEKLYGLNASGRSPYRANLKLFRNKGITKLIPPKTPWAWSVPGCVDGWDRLRERFGTMSWSQLLGPAVTMAEEGFPVAPIIAGGWRGAERMPDLDARTVYAPNGRAPRAGETFRNPALARSYRSIIAGGRDAFYLGPIADEMLKGSQAKGGLFIRQDFEDHTSTWVDPVSTTYRGHTVWELPPNGQGIAALEILNILEGYDLKGFGHNSADHLHRFIEAKKLAFADRATFYADPAFNPLPVAELISKPYADRQRKRIDPDRAARGVRAGDSKLVHGDTIYLTVVDKDRNAVSLIQSNYYGFGSGIIAGDTGFVLQNRGELFVLDEDHLNRLEPHKRPFHTIIPAMATKDGKPWLSFGVMGGDMQPQGHAQVFCNLVDFGMNVQQAGAVPRCRHDGSSTPTGEVETDGGEVYLEDGIDPAVAKALAGKGHRMAGSGTSYGGYQAIRIDWDSGKLYGGSEPRKDGMALGY